MKSNKISINMICESVLGYSFTFIMLVFNVNVSFFMLNSSPLFSPPVPLEETGFKKGKYLLLGRFKALKSQSSSQTGRDSVMWLVQPRLYSAVSVLYFLKESLD